MRLAELEQRFADPAFADGDYARQLNERAVAVLTLSRRTLDRELRRSPSRPVRPVRPAARPRARTARRRVSGSRAGPSDDGREPEPPLDLRHVAEILDLFERRAEERRQAADEQLIRLLRETDPALVSREVPA